MGIVGQAGDAVGTVQPGRLRAETTGLTQLGDGFGGTELIVPRAAKIDAADVITLPVNPFSSANPIGHGSRVLTRRKDGGIPYLWRSVTVAVQLVVIVRDNTAVQVDDTQLGAVISRSQRLLEALWCRQTVDNVGLVGVKRTNNCATGQVVDRLIVDLGKGVAPVLTLAIFGDILEGGQAPGAFVQIVIQPVTTVIVDNAVQAPGVDQTFTFGIDTQRTAIGSKEGYLGEGSVRGDLDLIGQCAGVAHQVTSRGVRVIHACHHAEIHTVIIAIGLEQADGLVVVVGRAGHLIQPRVELAFLLGAAGNGGDVATVNQPGHTGLHPGDVVAPAHAVAPGRTVGIGGNERFGRVIAVAGGMIVNGLPRNAGHTTRPGDLPAFVTGP